MFVYVRNVPWLTISSRILTTIFCGRPLSDDILFSIRYITSCAHITTKNAAICIAATTSIRICAHRNIHVQTFYGITQVFCGIMKNEQWANLIMAEKTRLYRTMQNRNYTQPKVTFRQNSIVSWKHSNSWTIS